MNTFTAIDFETAQGPRWSICQVGMVKVIKGQISAEKSIIIRPLENYYWRRFTDIHGIAWWDTLESPSFADCWPEISPWIENQTVVAHNGAFDFSCLSQTLDYYSLPHPVYEGKCTYRLFKQGLAALCETHDIELNHHDALSDARACAQLYLIHLANISNQSESTL